MFTHARNIQTDIGTRCNQTELYTNKSESRNPPQGFQIDRIRNFCSTRRNPQLMADSNVPLCYCLYCINQRRRT